MSKVVTMEIVVNNPDPWPDLHEKGFLAGELQAVAAVPGEDGGRPAVAVRVKLPDGRIALGYTSMRLFIGAAEAFLGQFANQIYDEPPDPPDDSSVS